MLFEDVVQNRGCSWLFLFLSPKSRMTVSLRVCFFLIAPLIESITVTRDFSSSFLTGWISWNDILLRDIESESDVREIWRNLTVCLRIEGEEGKNCQVAIYEVIMLENQFLLRKQSVEDHFLARRGKGGSIGIHSSPVLRFNSITNSLLLTSSLFRLIKARSNRHSRDKSHSNFFFKRL